MSTTTDISSGSRLAQALDKAQAELQAENVPRHRPDPREQTPAAAVRREFLGDDVIDRMIASAGEGGVALTGQGGFLPKLIRRVLERGMAAELDDHLGYDKGDPAGRGSGNSRNGSTPKTVATEVGDVALATPRDRAGTFEPRLVPKGARRLGGLEEQIISLFPHFVGGAPSRGDDGPRHRCPLPADLGHRPVPRDDREHHRPPQAGGAPSGVGGGEGVAVPAVG